MAFKHLTFFDSRGNKIEPRVENNILKFDIFFNTVSTGLFESEHIFLLEEVLVEKNETIENKYKFNKPKDLFDIQILKYINDYNDIVYKDVLENIFPHIALEKDYIDEFIKRYSSYIEKDFYYDREYYFLNETGKNYIQKYEEKLREYEYLTYNVEKEYVRPRSSYIQKTTDLIDEYSDETFIFFKWKNEKNSNNIFYYLIDYHPDNLYFDDKNKLCFKNDTKYPCLVPIYDNYLKMDETNPNWKLWFTPYKLDNGRNDAYEWNHTPTWTQEGVLNDLSYPQKYDVNGRIVYPGRRLLNSETIINKKPFQFNFALNSSIEGVYERTLEVYAYKTTRISKVTDDGLIYENVSNIYQLAEINFYGEVVAEDERLSKLLENFGRSVEEIELSVFRDVELDDENPDFIKLNEKRKELLLASNDLFPYMGSYKTFVNALKFFGFHDIRLKEYFINTVISSPQEGQIYYSSFEIPLDLDYSKIKNIEKLTDNELYYKSSRFGLYYNINQFSGNYDNDGWPIIEDSFQYTNEEILIKLYGLKKILEEKYLPHHARIINITGEGIYFAKIKMNNWQNTTPIIHIQKEKSPEFIGTPKQGYLKPLDKLLNIFRRLHNKNTDTGYYDKNGVFINENINQFTKIDNIIHCNLYEFMSDEKIDFPFDEQITLNVIERFHKTYVSLKNSMINSIYSSCNNTTINISEANIHNIKLLGHPVTVRLLDDIITWADLTARFEYVEKDLLKTSETINKTWDNIGLYSGVSIEWIIEHNGSDYCYKTSGRIEDKNEILLFLPKIGFYDVTCIIRDDTNFPLIKKKKNYFEVLKKQIDFIAFGRCIKNENKLSEIKDKWDENNTIWDLGTYSPISTTFNEADISWDSLFYENYKHNYMYINYSKNKIININYNNNEFELDGVNFYDNYIKKQNQLKYKRLTVSKNIENTEERFNFSIKNISPDSKIIISGYHPLHIGDKINLHKHIYTQDFAINEENIITLTAENHRYFEVNKHINLYSLDKLKKYSYKIKRINVDLLNNLMKLEVDNDGSLNEVDFIYLEYNIKDLLLNVLNVEHINNDTIIKVNNKNIQYIRKNIIDNNELHLWKVDYKFLAGYFYFDINTVTINNSENTVVKIFPNENLCEVDINFKVYYDDFDINESLKYSNAEMFYWDNLTQSHFDDIKYQSWDTLNYYNEPLLGFKIFEYRDKGFIKFNEIIFNYELINTNFNDRWYKLAELLNNSKQKYVSLFNYTVINNEYIQAAAKTYGNQNYIKFEYSLGTRGSKSTYPLLYLNEFENQYYSGDNNPALWNIYKNTEYNNENLKLATSGSFKFSETFIFKDEKIIPIHTTLFIIFDKYKNPDIIDYEWELWDEKSQKLLTKSHNNYIIWNFTENSIYSVTLKVTDINGNNYIRTKKSWIYVTKELNNDK